MMVPHTPGATMYRDSRRGAGGALGGRRSRCSGDSPRVHHSSPHRSSVTNTRPTPRLTVAANRPAIVVQWETGASVGGRVGR